MKSHHHKLSTLCSFLLLPVLLAGCDSRSLSIDTGGVPGADARVAGDQGVPQGDSGPIPGLDQGQPDTAPPDPCAPMDVRQDPDVLCKPAGPIGWFWDGKICEPFYCFCLGADCEALYATEQLCLQNRAAECLPPPDCLELSYEDCLDRSDCDHALYGGGCIDTETCGPGDPSGGNMLCWERGEVCVPLTHPCNTLNWSSCAGECYWWSRSTRVCFGGGDTPECCVEESYGFCSAMPGR